MSQQILSGSRKGRSLSCPDRIIKVTVFCFFGLSPSQNIREGPKAALCHIPQKFAASVKTSVTNICGIAYSTTNVASSATSPITIISAASSTTVSVSVASTTSSSAISTSAISSASMRPTCIILLRSFSGYT